MTLFVFQNGSDEARQTKLIDITLGYMTIHELAEQFFINPNSNSKSVDAIVPCLSTIFGNIVCQRLAFIYSYSTALYVEEEHIGKSLFFTGQHSKGSVKFIQNRFRINTIVQSLNELHKTGIHVIGVYLSGVNLRDIWIDIIRYFLRSFSATAAR